MYGIFVNECGGVRYASAIVGGYKPIETRSRNMLSALVGKRVAIIRTMSGKKPTVLGYADISGLEYWKPETLDARRDETLIPPGSQFDHHGRGKWAYTMSNPETCDPYELPGDAWRHGRSWCEFTMKGE